MRQADKTDLHKALLEKSPSSFTEQIPADAVVDGGELLQRLPCLCHVHLTHSVSAQSFYSGTGCN